MAITRVPHRRRRTDALAVVLLVVALLTGCDLLTPPSDPAPLRYRDAVFSAVTVTPDLVYGQAVDQAGVDQTLYFDRYEPTGDTAALRPLVIWVHGGYFSGGSRTSAELVDQATVLGKKGYVGASISYRTSANGCRVLNAECVTAIQQATQDAQAAVRFLRNNAETYRIDPNRIAIAGTSAGAITAINVGVRAPADETSGTPGVSSSVAAAVSLSGSQFMGTCDAGDAPLLMFHGTEDPILSYQGAVNTQACLADAGVWAHLVTWEGDGHVPYTAHRAEILDTETTFLFNALSVRGLL